MSCKYRIAITGSNHRKTQHVEWNTGHIHPSGAEVKGAQQALDFPGLTGRLARRVGVASCALHAQRWRFRGRELYCCPCCPAGQAGGCCCTHHRSHCQISTLDPPCCLAHLAAGAGCFIHPIALGAAPAAPLRAGGAALQARPAGAAADVIPPPIAAAGVVATRWVVGAPQAARDLAGSRLAHARLLVQYKAAVAELRGRQAAGAGG